MASDGLILQWQGKQLYQHRMPVPRMLDEVPELSVGEHPSNMIIEGDNLQVLAALKSRYAGQVDVIYIDPPYNTGKKDFLYSDKRFRDPDAEDGDAVYVTDEDGGRHTKWLNFMAPRLYMLREMLHDDRGVIFVSINDIELFRLGMLLTEIFGEDNHVGTLVWNSATDNNPTRIATEHEYILCYAKSKGRLPPSWRSQNHEAKTALLEAFRRFKAESSSLAEVQRKVNAFAREHRHFLGDIYRYRKVDDDGPYVARRNLDNPGKPGYTYDILNPLTGKPCPKPQWGWRYSEARMQELVDADRIIFSKSESKLPELKVPLEGVEFPLRSVIEGIDSRAGSNDLERLFGTRDRFKNPKPVALIQLLLDYTTRPDSIVLDGFAGSGTTGEAVLSLNRRDGGHRRFILIEEGERRNRFSRTLTAERIKRAIELDGYEDGFTFYKTGRKIDREAIVGLERDALASLICQADETGRGTGITRLNGHEYVIGRNQRGQAICLVWKGEADSEVTTEHLRAAAAEVTAAGLKRPFRIYGTFCRVGDTPSWKFCQIPDEILAQMHIQEDLIEELLEVAV